MNDEVLDFASLERKKEKEEEKIEFVIILCPDGCVLKATLKKDAISKWQCIENKTINLQRRDAACSNQRGKSTSGCLGNKWRHNEQAKTSLSSTSLRCWVRIGQDDSS